MRASVAMILLCSPRIMLADEDSALDGYWQSDGYGLLVHVAGDEMVVFEITGISCIRQRRFRINSSKTDRWYVGDESDPDSAAITIQRDPGPPERLHAHGAGAASEIIFDRSNAPPEICAGDAPGNPLYSFDVFWQTFAEHYPVFKRKGIDWRAQRDRYRPMLSEKSSDRQLFDTLVAMVEPLQDAHIRIERPGAEGSYSGFRRDASDTDDKQAFLARAQKASKILDEKYLRGPLRKYARGHVCFGRLPGDVGYLRITSFGDFGDGSFLNQLTHFEGELAEIFGEEMSGLVIDVRVNFGGSDVLGLAIAAHLATEPYVAYRKVARNDPKDAAKWTAPQPSTVHPKSPGFEGPVVVLTSRYTISAGETFTQALMGRRPEPVRIGQNTQGVYSDILRRRLPNGWEFGLPNELFLDRLGHYYDGRGIAPHHRVAVFERADLEAGRDPAVDKALELIGAATQ